AFPGCCGYSLEVSPRDAGVAASSPGDVSCAACAASAACAALLPARRRCTHPGMLRCGDRDTPSAPGGTSETMTLPAAVYAPSPTATGATNMLSAPVRAWLPMTLRCLACPS